MRFSYMVFAIALVLYVLYFPLRDISVSFLESSGVGVFYHSYASVPPLFPSATLGFLLLSLILIYAFLSDKIRNPVASIMLLLPFFLFGSLPYLALFLLLAAGWRFNRPKLAFAVAGFIFFQWLIVSVAMSVPDQSHLSVPDSASKVMVFAHSSNSSLSAPPELLAEFDSAIAENPNARIYIFACYGEEACAPYPSCTYFPGIRGNYIPQLTFFGDVLNTLSD